MQILKFLIFSQNSTNLSSTTMYMGLLEGSILMGACGAKEVLPMNPKLPADLFTSCLTTPIKTALHWYVMSINCSVDGWVSE